MAVGSMVAVVEAFAAAVGSEVAMVAEATVEVTAAATVAEAMVEATGAATAAAATGTATVADTGSGSDSVSDPGRIGRDGIMAMTDGTDIRIIPTISTPRAIPTARTDVIPTVMGPLPMLPTLREVDPVRRRIPWGAIRRRRAALS